jgi:preprotein translocase subunit SecA
MRLFGGERIQGLMSTLGIEDDVPIENKMVTNAIENAQRKVEGRNFGIRKNVLQYDDVMNRQREIIYGQRRRVLDGENLHEYLRGMVKESIDNAVDRFMAGEVPDDWNLAGLRDYVSRLAYKGKRLYYTPRRASGAEQGRRARRAYGPRYGPLRFAYPPGSARSS